MVVNCIEEVAFVIEATKYNWNFLSDKDCIIIYLDTKGMIEGRLAPIPAPEYLILWGAFAFWLGQSEQEDQQQTKTEVVGLGFLSIYALRYCVGRMTYMPSTIIDAIKENWELLHPDDRQQIQNDVQTAIATRHLGMAWDRETWLSFDEWIAENINKVGT
jgi:hypothetical protein